MLAGSESPETVKVLPVRARLIVLASGAGTLLQALLDAQAEPAYPAEVVAVVSDRPGAQALARADRLGLPGELVVLADFADREAWDKALAEAVADHRPDLVVLAGFMRILSPGFLARFARRVINTHPALLPSFPGAHAVRDALIAGVSVTGASVIWVDEGIDTGQVIARTEVPVLAGDDESSLHERIKVVEREMLVRVVAELVAAQESSVRGAQA
ncbi:MAG: phosphoribosylglycinamide formyltransferase [Geodermatophilaceae bacterium]|nr:phosphoribosylglycinamide formyltransferase [Geodermatophilaceae bacterium]